MRLRLLVVDIDPDAGGEASMAELEHEHGALPATVECITPRGGRHLYLIVPSGRPMSGNSAGKLGGGIDTRGQGGYALAPPSAVNGRHYTWSVDSGDRIAEAPGWLLNLLDRGGGNGHAASPEEWLELVTSEIAEGEGRNCAVTRLIGLLLRYLPPAHADTAAELVEAWNRAHCKPPLEPKELRTILDSIADREARRRGLP
jgi:Bifunctional DNA primase/polymerase, N-terminal/Primase C terminal 1 (PriCT-1)